MTHERTRTLRFAKTTQPGEDSELSRTMNNSGTVELIDVRIYAGAELDLKIEPIVLTQEGSPTPIVDFVGKQVIDGDDDNFDIATEKDYSDGDQIVVRYENQSGTEKLDFSVDVTVVEEAR